MIELIKQFGKKVVILFSLYMVVISKLLVILVAAIIFIPFALITVFFDGKSFIDLCDHFEKHIDHI